MSLDETLADALGIPFYGHSGVINVVLGRASYVIAMHHGIGGGRMRGGKTNNLERFDTIITGADIYLQGYTHTFDFFFNTCNISTASGGPWSSTTRRIAQPGIA